MFAGYPPGNDGTTGAINFKNHKIKNILIREIHNINSSYRVC